MTRFLATFLGTPQAREASGWDSLDDATRKLREREGMDAWMQWMQDHASAVVEGGSPLGKAKRIDKRGVSDTRNALTAWVVVQAESADAAAFHDRPGRGGGDHRVPAHAEDRLTACSKVA